MATETLPAEALRIRVPWDVARTADNRLRRGGHWGARHTAMKRAREAARLAWLEAGSPRVSGRVRVSIISRRGRSLDAGNVVGGCKPLIDGLFVDAITVDDGPRWFELGGVSQEVGRQWRGAEEVVFVVEEIG